MPFFFSDQNEVLAHSAAGSLYFLSFDFQPYLMLYVSSRWRSQPNRHLVNCTEVNQRPLKIIWWRR